MMPSAFDEENAVLDPPPGGRMGIESLSVCQTVDHVGTPVVVSCWKATREELDEIARTGRVWLIIMGETMAPAHVLGSSPFHVEDDSDVP